MNKLSKTAKKLDVIFNIAFWFLSIIGCLILLIAIILMLFTEDYPQMMASTLSVGFVNFEISDKFIIGNSILRFYYFLEIVLTFIALFVSCYVIKIIRKILEPMILKLPFSTIVSTNIKKLAWVSLIGGGIFSVVNFFAEIILYNIYDFNNIFLSNNITGCSLNSMFDLSFVVLFLILLLLSYIFQYGEVLQKESDETI